MFASDILENPLVFLTENKERQYNMPFIQVHMYIHQNTAIPFEREYLWWK